MEEESDIGVDSDSDIEVAELKTASMYVMSTSKC